jgi:hypothetical protein
MHVGLFWSLSVLNNAGPFAAAAAGRSGGRGDDFGGRARSAGVQDLGGASQRVPLVLAHDVSGRRHALLWQEVSAAALPPRAPRALALPPQSFLTAPACACRYSVPQILCCVVITVGIIAITLADANAKQQVARAQPSR